MNNKNYPIILGNKPDGIPTKAILGIKSQMGSGMDVMILGLKDGSDLVDDCDEQLIQCLDGRLYTTLHFCDIEALDKMIDVLQKTKGLWEKELMQDLPK